ncbi:hypothetical protein [uncultured Gammaproteobacteria bacterium]|nr:hypothetical protein [uncultured Gammaproteobacteria bacterium]
MDFSLNFSFLNFGKLHQENKTLVKDDANNPVDKIINSQIDKCHDDAKFNSKELLEKLKKIVQDNFDDIHDKTKYRLLVDIAVAYGRQNKEQEASEYLIDAKKYSEDCSAFHHAIYGYLIQSNKENAETLYQDLKNKNPQSNYVFMSEILLNDFNNIYPLEKDLPQNKLNEQDIVRTLAVCYHQAKKHEEALTWLEKCYKSGNEDLEIQSVYALSLLNYVRRDEVCFGNQWSEDDKSKLDLSIRLFSDLWEQYDSKKIKKLHLSDGIGLCDALQLKGDVEKAEKIATELLDIDNTHIEICYQCANLFVKQEKLDEAIEVLDAVFGKNNKTDFQLIELLFKNAQHKEVIEKINTVNIESLDILKQECLNIFQAIAIYNTQDKDSAYQFIDRCNFSTLDNQLNLFIFYSHIAKDQEKSSYQLQLIEGNSINDMAYHNKLQLAKIYDDLQDDEKAINLYQQLITINQSSEILERLLYLLFKVEDRVSIKRILDNFDKNGKTSGLYIRTSIKFYLLIGELNKALLQINEAIQKYPENLEIRLLWINIVIKMQKENEVKEYLRTSPRFQDALPEEQMTLSQLLSRYEQYEDAMKLGYETLRGNWNNENSHMAYIIGLMATKDNVPILDADVVDINTTFSIVNDFDESKTYTIVDSPDLSFNEIGLDHYIAKEAINKKTGDTFVTNHPQKKTWSIQEIVSKYVGLFRKSISEFNEIFPNSKKMYSLQVREFEDIKPFIDNRADVVNNIGDFYQKQPIPISSLAKFTKENVVELWQYLLSNKAIKVNVNTPSYQSKEPTKNNNGYIVDAITLYLIFRLEVHNNIKEYLDNIAIVQGTLDLFLQLKEKDIFESQMTISRQDGGYYRQDVSIENVQNSKIFFQDLYDWAIENCETIPADGNLANEHENFKELFDLSTRETLIAAKSSDRTLLTDDRNLREVVDKSFGINGIFSKDILYWDMTTEDSKYYNYLHQLRRMNCIYLPLELGELWNWICNCKIINNKFIPNDEVQEIKKYKDDFLNITNFDQGYLEYMQYSRTAIINVITHILISGDTYKQVRVDWIMDNLYFNYDIFNLNEQVAKETELRSFLTSRALLFYAQNSSVKSKNYMDWIEEKFIQHNKSSNLIKNVANALIEDLFISKDLFTLEQTSLYINNFISQLPVAIKNEVEKIRG